jgi:hypothetical protein
MELDHKGGQDARTSSGGDADRTVGGTDWAKSAHSNVDLHFAPAVEEAARFPWFNKPWSFNHWVKNVKGGWASIKEDIIVIMDPDEFFLSPLKTGVPAKDLLVKTSHNLLAKIVDDVNFPDRVKPGTAVAQMYGLGAGWVQPRPQGKFDRAGICGVDSYCAKVNDEEAWGYYSVGPPYLMDRADFKKVAIKWWDIMRPVYAQDKGDIQADMYGEQAFKWPSQ